jgi:hypothetical protein
MSDLASSGAPPNALHVWSDGRRIYVEIPGAKGPYITAYDYNYRGLDLILSLLGLHRTDYDYKGEIPKAYIKPKDPVEAMREAQREATLRRLGILK